MVYIRELYEGQKKVDIEGQIVEKSGVREVKSRFKNEAFRLCDAVLADETGSIKLTLWNEQIEQVSSGDTVKVENGYVTAFKGEIQLNIGKYGKLTVKS